jgi:RHS repeat-associated protein
VTSTTGSLNRSFVYDQNGNQIGGGDHAYDFDAENRLVAITKSVPATSPAVGFACVDFTDDDAIDLSDTLIILGLNGKARGQPGFDFRADLDWNGVINSLDYDRENAMYGSPCVGETTHYIRDGNGMLLKRSTAGNTQTTTVRPTGQGAYQEWAFASPSAPHYQNVDEVTADDDGSQFNDQGWHRKDTHSYPSPGVPAGAIIDKVTFKFRWKHYDNYTPNPASNMWAIFRQSSTDTRGPIYASTNAAGWKNDQWAMTVNPRTGQPWTAAELNAGVEFGFEIHPTAGAWNYVTQTWIEVTYRRANSTVYVGDVYEKAQDGSVTKYYQAFGRSVAMRAVPSGGGAGTLSYLLTDHLGGTVEILNASGVTQSELKYWPYGGVRSGGITQTDKLFTGQQKESPDQSMGLYDYGARFYSTVTARFGAVDPVVGAEQDPQSWNGHTYVRNNPLRWKDPTGQCIPGQCPSDIAGLRALKTAYDSLPTQAAKDAFIRALKGTRPELKLGDHAFRNRGGETQSRFRGPVSRRTRIYTGSVFGGQVTSITVRQFVG